MDSTDVRHRSGIGFAKMSQRSVVLGKIDDRDDENHAPGDRRRPRERKDGIQHTIGFNTETPNCSYHDNAFAITPSPSTVAPNPSADSPSPSTVAPTPSTEPPSPSTDASTPCTVAQTPSTDAPNHSVATPSPSVGPVDDEIDGGGESVDGQRFSGCLFRCVACLAMAVGATVALEFALADVSLTFQRPMLVAMQLSCFVFLFYSLAVYLRSVWWINEVVFAIFCVCITVEFLIGYVAAQDPLNAAFLQPLLTLLLLLSVGGVSMFLSLDVVRCALVMTGISIVRFLAYSTISDLPPRLKPVLAYCSGAVGIVAARYRLMDTHSVSVSCLDLSNEGQKEDCVEVGEATLKSSPYHNKPRRISLPNLTRKNAMSSSATTESTLLMKADGLLEDLIVDPTVPRHIVRVLNAVKSLLKQSAPSATTSHRSKSIPHVSLSSNTRSYPDLPYTDDYIHFYSNKNFHHTTPGMYLNRCTSSFGIWTTTTSATGMPSLESELSGKSKFPMYGELSYFGRSARNRAIGDEHAENHHVGDDWLGGHQSSSEKDSDDASESPESGENDEGGTKFNLGVDQDHVSGSERSRSHSVTVPKHHIMFSESSKHRDYEDVNISDELENSSLLDISQLQKWDYPIFELAAKAPDTLLCRVAYKIFRHLRFFELFSIPVQEFLNFFHALELGYHNNHYHNRIHATDVLHAVFYMTTQPLSGFVKVSPVDDYKNPESEQDVGQNSANSVETTFQGADDCMRTNFLPLELMALYTAAAMHDYDHPGRTNAFLVATCNPLAVLYNNRAVLENHHASTGWRLLLSTQRHAWLVNLNNAQFKRFRYLVLEEILVTDLARHFDLLADFNAKLNDEENPGIDWLSEGDRQMVSNMLIKMADINGPCKPKDLHKQWTYRITEEFYEQGDEEESLGLTISPYMNRHQPQLAKLQESFINHLVAPLCNSLSSAGLLPVVQTSEQDADTDTDITVFDKDSSANVVCPMVQNIKENHRMWIEIIEKESAEKSTPVTENHEIESSAAESNIPSDTTLATEESDDA